MEDIHFYTKNVYGIDRYYIVNKDIAKVVSKLTRRKTLENIDIIALRALGHSLIEVVPPKEVDNELQNIIDTAPVEPLADISDDE